MKRTDWQGKKITHKTNRLSTPVERMTIEQLRAKVDKLNTRCKIGADKVLHMRMTNDGRFNLASAFLGQLQAERDKLQRQLDNELAWKEAGWEG